MSYILHIWQHPDQLRLPATARDAAHLVTILQAQRGTFPLFRQLASRLTARHPCIGSAAIAAVPEPERAWAGGPLDGVAGCAVYDVALAPSALAKVKPFVIDTAHALGLHVLDPQSGELFLSPQSAEAEHSVAQGDVRGMLVFGLDGLLSPHGFVYNKKAGRFEHNFTGGFHRIIVPKTDFNPDYPFSLGVAARLDCVSEPITRLCGPGADTEGDTMRLRIEHFLDRPQYTFAVHTSRDMAAAMRVIGITLEKKILPFLDSVSNLAQFERFINADTTSDAQFPRRHETGLVAAHLANPAHFEMLAARYLQALRTRQASADVVERFQKLAAALRAHFPRRA